MDLSPGICPGAFLRLFLPAYFARFVCTIFAEVSMMKNIRKEYRPAMKAANGIQHSGRKTPPQR